MVSETRREFTLVTPFVTDYGANTILNNLSSDVKMSAIFGFRRIDFARGSSSYSAVYQLSNRGETRNLPGLHAKVYMSDSQAIVTSGNLTEAGLTKNAELGVLLEDQMILGNLRTELDSLWQRAIPLDNLPSVEEVQPTLDAIKGIHTKIQQQFSVPLPDTLFGDPVRVQPKLKAGRYKSLLEQTSLIQSITSRLERIVEREKQRILQPDSEEMARELRRRLRKTRFVFFERDRTYSTQEFHAYAKSYFSEFCDDTYLCQHEKSRRPEWRHQVRLALQSLKEDGYIDNVSRGVWKFTDKAAQRWSPRGQKTDQICIQVIKENPSLLTKIRSLVSVEEVIRWTGALTGVQPQQKKKGETEEAWLDRYKSRLDILREITETLDWLTKQVSAPKEDIWCCLRAIQYEIGLENNMNPVKLRIMYEIQKRLGT